MILTFTQSSDQSFGGVPAYEAEFEVTSNFALHIERTRGDAALILKQRTGGGKYALVDDFNYAKSKGEVLDYEASVTIPKYIKIVSEVEPTLAEIVTDGEVTEIKSQSKVVEVTTNGTTEVVPDSGFAYLSKVNIKTNVPQSGEGGGSTGGRRWKYYDVTNVSSTTIDALLPYLCHIIKVNVSDSISIGGGILSSVTQIGGTILAMGCDIDTYYLGNSSGGLVKIEDYLLEDVGGSTREEGLIAQFKLVPITEEEFYNLNA